MPKDVIAVFWLGEHRLMLTFEDGEQRVADVSTIVPFDEILEPLKDLDSFRQVRVDPDLGTIVWPNGADLCPDVLYECSSPLTGPSGMAPAAAERS